MKGSYHNAKYCISFITKGCYSPVYGERDEVDELDLQPGDVGPLPVHHDLRRR